MGSTVYSLDVAVTEDNIDQIAQELVETVGGLMEEADGSVTAGPTRVDVGGLPALRLEGSAVTPEGDRIQWLWTLVFDGDTEYFLNCQFTPEHAEEMERAVTRPWTPSRSSSARRSP